MKPATNSLAKKKHAIPHVYIILLIIILLATVLTYIVPAGQFDRETVDNVKMVIPGTYHRIDQTPVNLFDMFVAIPQGFVSMANIVILIYMCVAGMGILTSTGALERVFGSFISKVGAKGRVVMLKNNYVLRYTQSGKLHENTTSAQSVKWSTLEAHLLSSPKIISAFRSNDMFRLCYPRISIIKKLIPYFKTEMNYSSRKRQHEFNEYT